jgi:hypothetical protein
MAHAFSSLASAVSRSLRKLRASLDAARSYAVMQRHAEPLDAATLRDLGLSASELGSYWAESHRRGERTRRRVYLASTPRRGWFRDDVVAPRPSLRCVESSQASHPAA